MLNLYYRIWVDCIKKAQQQPGNEGSWQFWSMISMTMAMEFSFLFCMALLQKFVFHNYFYEIDFSFLPERVNNVLKYLLLFILPCAILNYVLIFRNKRYKKLLERYPFYNGKLFAIYFTTSMMLPIIIFIGAVIISKL